MTSSRRQRPSAIAEPVRDRDLVRLYWPVELRPAFDTLLDIDDALAGVVVRATEPGLAAIKLAWWRERLEELDVGVFPAEPRLRAVAAELLPRGVHGAELAGLTEAWAALLDEQPDLDRVAEGGARLFAIAANLLGASDPMIEPAGRLYGHANAARRGLIRMYPAAELQQLVDAQVRLAEHDGNFDIDGLQGIPLFLVIVVVFFGHETPVRRARFAATLISCESVKKR